MAVREFYTVLAHPVFSGSPELPASSWMPIGGNPRPVLQESDSRLYAPGPGVFAAAEAADLGVARVPPAR